MFRWTHGIVLGAIQKLIQNDKSFPTTQQEDKWTVPTKQQKEGVGIQSKLLFLFKYLSCLILKHKLGKKKRAGYCLLPIFLHLI